MGDRYVDSVTPGNRRPREFKGRRAPLGSARDRAVALLEYLEIFGPTTWVDIRRVVLGGDRGPLYSIRAALLAGGLIYQVGSVKGSPLYTTPDDLRDREWRVLIHLDNDAPNLVRSQTHPGQWQVRCGLCRLSKRAFPTQEEALLWYFGTHVREASVHGY